MEKIELVDSEWLTRLTGDPFADIGGYVIDYLYHLPIFKNKPVMDLIEWMADIYINNWKAKLHPFFLNSTITQAQYKEERKMKETLVYYSDLINEKAIHQKGYCQISGRKASIFPAGRHNHILSGSGTFVNFHSYFQPGLYLSKEILIRMFFVPFGVHRLADKICLIQSNNPVATEFFVFQNCLNNFESVKNNTSTGPLKSIFNNPATALFAFIDDYKKYLEKELNKEEKKSFNSDTLLHLYHFSNLGQKPEIIHYSMEAEVFRFYTFCQEFFTEEWQRFIKAHANPGNLKKYFFDQEAGKWYVKEGEEVAFEDYAKWKNLVLNNLLHHRTLRIYFLRWCQYRLFPMEIVYTYQLNIRQMKAQTIEKITLLASFICEHDENFIEKCLKTLNIAASRKELRQFFLQIQKLSFDEGHPLINTEDVQYLFPENSYPGHWMEVRDVLIMDIYQKRLTQRLDH